jgi:hypothetical protein
LLYLLDANVLIDANRDYYPIARVPEFWEWLVNQGLQGVVKIPIDMYEEIKEGTDDLADWIKQDTVKAALLYDRTVDVETVNMVVNDGYAHDLTDDELEKLGRDPFLVAYAIPAEACVVTTEISKPSKKRANRKLPDVCRNFDIPTINTFQFIRTLNFTTKWNATS